MESHYPATLNQDSKNIALLVWIGTIFFSFVPGLIVYLLRKDDGYVQDQAKEALNWAITALLGFLLARLLAYLLLGALAYPVVALVNLIFCVMGAVAASQGKAFRVLFALRLVK